MIARLWKELAISLALLAAAPAGLHGDDWPQWRGPQRDGVWRESGIVERFASARLEPIWRAPISSGYSGPTVAAGRVYVTDRVVEPEQVERVHCFEAATGRPVWSHRYACPYRGVSYDAGPRASVLIEEGRAYSLGTMGHLFCFEAATGRVLWQHDLVGEFDVAMPEWGISASPIVEGDLLVVMAGGKEACFVAFDRVSGVKRWQALSDRPSYSAPIVIDHAGRRVLVGYTGDNVVGLDPRSGELLWKQPFPATRMVIGVASPVLDGRSIFLTNFFDGSMMLDVAPDRLEVRLRWQRAGASEKETDALHSIIATPLLRDGYVYGVDSYGELRCLDGRTGDRVWENTSIMPRQRWGTAHVVVQGERDWLFTERGELLIGRLNPQGFHEHSRTKIIDPTTDQLRRDDGVCWSHPAFADRKIFARNDRELLCVNLAAE